MQNFEAINISNLNTIHFHDFLNLPNDLNDFAFIGYIFVDQLLIVAVFLKLVVDYLDIKLRLEIYIG